MTAFHGIDCWRDFWIFFKDALADVIHNAINCIPNIVVSKNFSDTQLELLSSNCVEIGDSPLKLQGFQAMKVLRIQNIACND